MNLRVFKISGIVWRSESQADFTGCFVKMEGTDVIEGYMEEKGYTPYDPVRYIKGLYIEKTDSLVFTVMCKNMITLIYGFSNLKDYGFGFWFPYRAGEESKAWIKKLEEVQDESKKETFLKKVSTVREKDRDTSSRYYKEFQEAVQTLLEHPTLNRRISLESVKESVSASDTGNQSANSSDSGNKDVRSPKTTSQKANKKEKKSRRNSKRKNKKC